MLFKAIGDFQFSPVGTSLPTQSGEGAVAPPLCDSIVSINNASEKMDVRQLPVKCLIEFGDDYRVSSYSNLTNLDYAPPGNEWNCEAEAERTCTVVKWSYKNSTINVENFAAPPPFTIVRVHPSVALTQEFKTLKDIFDFVKKREDAPQAGSV